MRLPTPSQALAGRNSTLLVVSDHLLFSFSPTLLRAPPTLLSPCKLLCLPACLPCFLRRRFRTSHGTSNQRCPIMHDSHRRCRSRSYLHLAVACSRRGLPFCRGTVLCITCLALPAHVNALQEIFTDGPEQHLIIFTPESHTH